MNIFHYKNQQLHCEDVSLAELAEEHGTPLFVYSQAYITDRWNAYQDGLKDLSNILPNSRQEHKRLFYALKANPTLGLLKVFQQLGAGFDTVSIGEIKRAMLAGAAARDILFSGVGKSVAELEFAISSGIGAICVESAPEFERLCSIAKRLGKSANLSVRVNPDIQADTHPSIRTGGKEHKFGVSLEVAAELLAQGNKHPHINLVGFSCHIGSQILDIAPFIQAAKKMRGFYDELLAKGIKVNKVSLGGGFGVSYKEGEEVLAPEKIGEMAAAFAATHPDGSDTDARLVFEPGRSLVASAGVLLTKLEYMKKGEDNGVNKNFAIVDAAMNDLIRPILYDAYHEVLPLQEVPAATPLVCDIVGPVCESGDVLARQRSLAAEQGDLLAIKDVGAYSATMSSNYNSRQRAAEVLVNGATSRLIKRREPEEDLWRLEQNLPE